MRITNAACVLVVISPCLAARRTDGPFAPSLPVRTTGSLCAAKLLSLAPVSFSLMDQPEATATNPAGTPAAFPGAAEEEINTGQDFTRPLTRIDIRLKYVDLPQHQVVRSGRNGKHRHQHGDQHFQHGRTSLHRSAPSPIDSPRMPVRSTHSLIDSSSLAGTLMAFSKAASQADQNARAKNPSSSRGSIRARCAAAPALFWPRETRYGP